MAADFEIVCLVLDLVPYRLRIAYRLLGGDQIGTPGEVMLWEEDLNLPGIKTRRTHQMMPAEIKACLRETLAHARYAVRMALEQQAAR